MAVQLRGHCIIQTGWMDGEKGKGRKWAVGTRRGQEERMRRGKESGDGNEAMYGAIYE